MQTSTISIFFTCATCCLYATLASPIEDNLEDIIDRFGRDLVAANPDMSPTDLRKLLLKKLRFREIVSDNLMSPEEIIASENDLESEERHNHKTSKRRKNDDLMNRVRALLSGIKERQIKQSMELPSLRFGRSGFNMHRFN